MANRIRFVTEIDSQLLNPVNQWAKHITKSEAMRKALSVPSRVFDLVYGPTTKYLGDAFKRERLEWGSYLVSGPAENGWLMAAIREATIVSFKISSAVFDHSGKKYVIVHIVVRKNRVVLLELSCLAFEVEEVISVIRPVS